MYQDVHRNRRDLGSTVDFVTFFTGYVTDVSYGTKDVTLSSGETITVQSAVQEIPTELIISLYKINYGEKKTEFERDAGIAYPIKLFCDSTLRKIAKTIPLGRLKSLRY